MKKNHPNPKAIFNEHVAPLFKNSTLIHAGGGIVPTRRPIWSLVHEGILLIGDAGCTVNPIHGGGIGSGMQSAVHAANAINKYFETLFNEPDANLVNSFFYTTVCCRYAS